MSSGNEPVVLVTRAQAEGIILFVVLVGILFVLGWLSWGTAALAGFAGLVLTKWRKTPTEREHDAQQDRNSWG
jgi:hypothetical protein